MGNPYLRIEIWRPFNHSNHLIQAFREDEKGEVFRDDRLFELIFSWETELDVWAGSENPDSQGFQKAIQEEFQSDLPPEERSILKLAGLVNDFAPKLDSTPLSWHDWGVYDEKSAETERGQSVRAFMNHLKWLVRTYTRMPNASVTIR